jgi:hypothetical protein
LGPATAFGLGAAAAVLGPAVGAGTTGWKGPAIVAAALLPFGGAALPLAGFALFGAGFARILVAARCPAPAASGLASLLAAALLVLPFVGDPLVEPGGPGKGSPAAIAVLVGGSPLCASVGGGLGVDLLHSPRAYGGLSRIGTFYAYRYPRPVAAAGAWAAAGVLLAAGASLARRRRGS